MVSNLRTVELKAFIPAKDYELSKRFYQDVGFTLASDTDGIAYFHHENVSFLLQRFSSSKTSMPGGRNCTTPVSPNGIASRSHRYNSNPGACETSCSSIPRACCGE
jgi:catechol 2,3-dioxygenase-like lactoylglutathione lyase family enzyme